MSTAVEDSSAPSLAPKPLARVWAHFRRRYVYWIVCAAVIIPAATVLADWWIAFPEGAQATYVGRATCIDCHKAQHDSWLGSHHDLAMDVATPETVLGNFDQQQFDYHGLVSRFSREGDKFFVTTDGPDGKPCRFEVSYTFGVEPLQQYMVQMESGRIQVLPFAWDTKAKRWFHLYQDETRPVRHDDPLHWTQPGQNWNHVCADCHSTNLQKGYDNATDTFYTTYSEIDVSCEACHGPGSMHVELAEKKWFFWDRNHGYGLAKLKGPDASAQLDACARCHSHRSSIYPGFHAGGKFLDHYLPALLDTGLYHDDGQIDEEVYEYGSFHQSLMHRKGVRCTDCHDPHTTKVKFQGNRLCTECHLPAKYDTPLHHHHQAGGAGAQCVECHMPTKKYMVVDPRRDHSLRVPRPDLSVKLGTPNACTGCHLHEKKSGQADEYPKLVAAAREDDAKAKERLRALDDWAAQHVAKWFGPKRHDDPHYAVALAGAMRGRLDGLDKPLDRAAELDRIASQLVALTKRTGEVSAIVRASAVSLMPQYPSAETLAATKAALKDRDPLVRLAAARNLEAFHGITTATRWEFDRLEAAQADHVARSAFIPLRDLATPLLADSVRAVRFEGARQLAVVPPGLLEHKQSEALKAVLAEFRAGCLDSGDQPAAHVLLAELAASQMKFDDAEREYRLAMDRLRDFIPARTGLAELYRHQGKRDEAEKLLREALAISEKIVGDERRRRPQEAELCYRLGLLVAVDRQRQREGANLLARAVRLAPDHGRGRFAWAAVLEEMGDLDAAESQYLETYQRFPQSTEYRDGLASIYQARVNTLSRQERWREALPYAEKLARLLPGDRHFAEQLRMIQQKAR